MKHLSELLERLERAEYTYKTCDSSLDGSLAFILAQAELKSARFEFDLACREYVISNVLNKQEETCNE